MRRVPAAAVLLAAAIAAGGAAVICGVALFLDVLAHYEEPQASGRYL